MVPRHFPRRRRLAVLAALLLAACSDSSTGVDALTGTWALVSVNGFPLPVVVFEDEVEIEEVTELRLVLNSGGSCTLTVSFRVTLKENGASETFDEVDTCTFSSSGNNVTLTFAPDDVETATVSGNTMTLILGEGTILVLQKQ